MIIYLNLQQRDRESVFKTFLRLFSKSRKRPERKVSRANGEQRTTERLKATLPDTELALWAVGGQWVRESDKQ